MLLELENTQKNGQEWHSMRERVVMEFPPRAAISPSHHAGIQAQQALWLIEIMAMIGVKMLFLCLKSNDFVNVKTA